MKILVFSDIHNDARALEALMAREAGHYFAAGDLVSWARGLDKMGPILQRRAGKVSVLPGNHESERDIAAFCGRFGLGAFHGETIEMGGYHVAGLGYSSPTPFNTPGEYTEAELASRLSRFAGRKPLILICHCPPKGTLLDRAGAGRHFGSQAVRDFVEAEQPEFFFCGHIHEAEGAMDRIGRTTGVNVGKRGYLLDFDSMKKE